MTRFVCHAFDDLDVDLLYRIVTWREAVFVVEQECVYLDADGRDPQGWHVVGLDVDDALIAYARVLPPGTTYEEYPSIGRVLVVPAHRGRGVARELMLETLVATDALFPGRRVKISAQSHLVAFYESLGFELVGEPYLEDGIPHRAMTRTSAS